MQAKIVVVYDPLHQRVDIKVNSMLTHDIGAIIRTKCPLLSLTWRKFALDVHEAMMKETYISVFYKIIIFITFTYLV